MVVSKVPVSTWLCHYQHQLGNFRSHYDHTAAAAAPWNGEFTPLRKTKWIDPSDVFHRIQATGINLSFYFYREESQKVSENLEY